jgi:hypothetical protein
MELRLDNSHQLAAGRLFSRREPLQQQSDFFGIRHFFPFGRADNIIRVSVQEMLERHAYIGRFAALVGKTPLSAPAD